MPEVDKNLVEQDYLCGMKLKDIADKYGVTINTVKSWTQRYGWSRKGVHTKEKVCTPKTGAPIPEVSTSLAEPLTEKERLFCEIYVRNFNATTAAIKAGYTDKYPSEMGYQLLQKTTVRGYINHLKALKKEAIMAGVDDLVEKYMRIAFADITDFVEFGRSTVPVMGPFGPILVKNLDTGKKEPLLKEVNDVRLKESSEVDGGLISEVKLGKDGASIKLLSQEKAMEWLGKYFEAHPADKHRLEYENKKLVLQERVVKVQEDKLHGVSEDVDKIKEGLKDIADIINRPVPNRVIDDE